MGGHRKCLGVDHRNIAFVLDIHINVAVAIGNGLFRRPAQVDCANDGTIFRVNHGCVWRGVAEIVNTLIKRVE